MIAFTYYNSILFQKSRILASILPGATLMACINCTFYIVYSLITGYSKIENELKERKSNGWLGNCDTYQIKNNRLYYNDTLISEADPKTAVYIDCHYAKDSNYVYVGHVKIEGADPKTFETVNWSWQRDKNNYYWAGEKKPYIDIHSFKLLDFNYSMDRNHVYYYGDSIPGADPLTFKHIEDSRDGRDSKHCYREGKIVDWNVLLTEE